MRKVRLWRLDPLATFGLALLLALVLTALLAPWLAPHDPTLVRVADRLKPSSAHYPLGTDHLGRDLLSRILYGGRVTLGAAALAATAEVAVGLAVGLTAGYFGGWWDALVGRLIDILLAIPGLLVALAVAGVRPGLGNILLPIVAVGWVGFARVVRSLVLSLRERPYVEAARAAGAGHRRILIRHILPGVLGPVAVLATLQVGHLILAISGLSFLGLGLGPPTPEWGAMLNESRAYFFKAPRLMVVPGLAITLAVVGMNLLGDGLRDLWDPQTGSSGRK